VWLINVAGSNITIMRHDHTHWLTHFVRDRLPEQDFPGESEEDAGYYEVGELEPDAGAFSVLKTIIRLGGIIPPKPNSAR